MENGANGSTIRETGRERWPTSIEVPAAQSLDFTVMCPFGPPLRW